MARQIVFEYEEKEYILEFDRKIFVRAERAGFSPAEAVRTPLSQAVMLFGFGLLKNQDKISEARAEELFEGFSKDFSLDDFLTFCLTEYTSFFEMAQSSSKTKKKELNIKEV